MTEIEKQVMVWLKSTGAWMLPAEVAQLTREDPDDVGDALAKLYNGGHVIMRREPGTKRIYKFAAL